MFAIMAMALATAQSDVPVCRDVRVKGTNGRYRTVLMCRDGDGRWRTAAPSAVPARAAPAPVAIAAPVPTPTPAPTAASAACTPEKVKKGGFRSLLGRVAGDVVGGAAGMMRLPISAQTRYSLNQMVSDAIACRLSPRERDQAATATTRAVAQPVGASSAWTSTERRNVAGSSTVTAQTALPNGTVCKDVRDVATIDGEETAVTKRMCRAPGATGFSVVRASA